MIGAICPNFSDKKVKAQFEELKELFGEDKAYLVWHRNNGNPIDKAPNGAESILFKDLVELYLGDRKKAIKNKCRAYTSDFYNWYGGQWTEQYVADHYRSALSALLDEDKIKIFNKVQEFCDRLGFEFVDQSEMETFVDFANKVISIQDYTSEEFDLLKSKVAFGLMPRTLKESIIDAAKKNKIVETPKKKKNKKGNQILDDLYEEDRARIINDLYEAIHNNNGWIAEDKSLFEKIKLFISDLINKILGNQEYYESLINQAAQDINDENSKWYRTVIQDGFEQKELDIEKLKAAPQYNIYKVLTDLGASLDGSAAVRMQGTLYRAGEEDFHDLDFAKKYDSFSWDVSQELYAMILNYKTATDNFKNLDKRVYMDLRKYMLENCTEHLKNTDIYKELSKYYSNIRVKHAAKTKELGLFVTLEVDGNPVDIFYEKEVQSMTVNGIKVTDFSHAFAAKLIMGRDKDIRDILNFRRFGKFKAIRRLDKNGEPLVQDVQSYNEDKLNDRYSLTQSYKTDDKLTAHDYRVLLENILRDYSHFHRKYGSFRHKKSIMNRAEKQKFIDMVEEAFGLIPGTIRMHPVDWMSIVPIDEYKIQLQLDLMQNKLDHSTAIHWADKLKLFIVMKRKFPHLKDIKFVRSNGKWRGRFHNGHVEVNLQAPLDILVEECLHPFVEAIYDENYPLFRHLLIEARRDFKALRIEIANSYKDKRGFTAEDRYKEHVTQALARHLADIALDPKKAAKKSIWQRAWDWILKKLGISGVKELPSNMTLQLLAEAVLKAEHINISESYYTNKTSYNMNNGGNQALDDSITHLMYQVGLLIEQERNQYVQNVVSNYLLMNPNARPEDIANVRNSSTIRFDQQKLNILLSDIQKNLAQLFGLVIDSDGYFKSSYTDLRKLMYEHFINSLQARTFKQYLLATMSKSKYEQVGCVLNTTSVANVIYSAIYNGDLTTLDKQLARDYVRMFWQSDLIQAGLKVVDNNRAMSAQQREDALVDRMTLTEHSARSTDIILWLRNFWAQLNNIIHNLFNGVSTISGNEDILKAVDAAFMVSENLTVNTSTQPIFDRQDGVYDTSTLLSEQDKQILEKIRNGYTVRIKANLARKIKDLRLISKLRLELEKIGLRNPESIDDIFNTIDDFLSQANVEIGNIATVIDKEFLSDPEMNWEPDKINFIKQDLIGHYLSSFAVLQELFSDKSSAVRTYCNYRVSQDPNAKDLIAVTNQLTKDLVALLRKYKSQVVLPFCEKVINDAIDSELGVLDSETLKYNAKMWLQQDVEFGDLLLGEVLIGMASRSKSEVVRIVDMFMSAAEMESKRDGLRVGQEIYGKYKRLKPLGSQVLPVNYQRRFMELDSNGTPTGYFSTDTNRGQFYIEKDLFEQHLREKYDLDVTEDGKYTVFPEEDYTADDSIYNQYNDELDDWLGVRCNRRYKTEYYKKRRRFLSPSTISAQNALQRQIDLLVGNAYVEIGDRRFIDMSRLTQNEQFQLEALRKQKRDLGSHYIFEEDSNGIMRVQEKDEAGIKMADEITAWNMHIEGKIDYKVNWDQYNLALDAIKLKYNNDPQKIAEFENNNTRGKLTKEFYELLLETKKVTYMDPEIRKLLKRYSEILNTIKQRTGSSVQNLQKLGFGLTTDTSAWLELHRLEQEIADRKRQDVNAIVNSPSLSFLDVARMLYVPLGPGSSQSFYETLVQLWNHAVLSNTNLSNVFNNLFIYRNENGRYEHLRAFRYLTSKSPVVTVNGRDVVCFEPKCPISEYSELDEASLYVNEKFQQNGPSMLIFGGELFDNMKPSISVGGEIKYKDKNYDKFQTRRIVDYTNDDYNSLSDEEKDYVRYLDETCDEYRKLLPESYRELGTHRLPGVSGRSATVFANSMRGKEYLNGIKYIFRNTGIPKMSADYMENDDDVSTNSDIARRPDGTPVNNIPIRYTEPLKNRLAWSQDVVGSVIMFCDMALNFKHKSENLPTIELLKYAVSSEDISGHTMTQQYKKIDNMLNQRYYGKETTLMGSDEIPSAGKKRGISFLKTGRRLATLSMLAMNWTTIEVGYLDALCSLIVDGLAGRYFTMADVGVGLASSFGHIPWMLANLGNPNVSDKLLGAMQYNQLSVSNARLFGNTDRNKVSKLLRTYTLMGGYTMTDYLINTVVLRATYHHYKLVTLPDGTLAFLSKEDCIVEFGKNGYSEKDAINIWKNADVNLWNAYEMKDNVFTVKDLYKDIVTKRLENKIATRLQSRTALYNGVVPESEKAKLQQNVFGSYLTLMRGFFINQYWERFHTGGSYIKEGDSRKITLLGEYTRSDIGIHNYAEGNDTNGTYYSFASGMLLFIRNLKHLVCREEFEKLNRNQKYAIKHIIAQIALITAMGFLSNLSVLFARKKDYNREHKDDKDPVWMLNIEGILPWSDKHFLELNLTNTGDKFLDWCRWKTALVATRLFTERVTPFWPGTVLEIISSPSTAKSYLDDLGEVWNCLLFMFNNLADKVVTQGGYSGSTKRNRAFWQIFSSIGVNKLMKQWHTKGIKSTFNFYRKLSPTNLIIPSQEEWEDLLEANGEVTNDSSSSSSGVSYYY